MSRAYRLGRRQSAVDLTTNSILAAARELVAQGPASQATVGAVARRAGVSRLTVYNRFGSRAGLLEALAPPHERRELGETDPLEALRRHLQSACASWAGNPALYRHLPHAQIDHPHANPTLP